MRVALQLVTEQGQSWYRKLRRESPAGVSLNYYAKYCIIFEGSVWMIMVPLAGAFVDFIEG